MGLTSDVRYWPKADISVCTAHVRNRGTAAKRNKEDQGTEDFMHLKPGKNYDSHRKFAQRVH